ncbi:hypothetical protein HPB47_008726 [Ixodes persulcatus]|uniref:Uncharacterized protein n=1 Tax=Ixodes persulcatus TaxID=34615 RepID=A0AC60P4G8_IXOPE|nr:hypothetical protein HPB47_008726 [Ixodes persulcatus]
MIPAVWIPVVMQAKSNLRRRKDLETTQTSEGLFFSFAGRLMRSHLKYRPCEQTMNSCTFIWPVMRNSFGGASIAAIIFHNHDQYVRFVILMLESLGLRNCLIPLPTWTPSNWEQTMLHRQVAMAEGFNRTQEEQRFAELPPNISVSQEKHTELSTTGATATEVLGTHLVVAGEGTFSGTLHVSRKISSILNIVRKPIDTSQKGKVSSRRSVTVAPSSEKKPKSKSKKIPVGNLGKGSSTSTTGTVAGQTAVDSEGRLLVLVPPLDVMALPDAAPGPEAPPAPPAVAALPAKRTKRKKVRTPLA